MLENTSSEARASAADASAARKKFEALVARLETVARENSKGYNRRIAALALLGYAYIFAVLLVCLALLVGLGVLIFSRHFNTGFLKLGFFVAIFTFAIVRSLFVRIEPPEGRELSRSEAPQLFAHVDEIGQKLEAPRPHHVLLTDEFNAAVAQVPRFGLFGGQRNYLIVGLQLMAALSPEEFKSVLAHEFGHLSANHSKFSGRIYRVRRTWLNLMEQIGDGFVFGPFFGWYAPYFAAYSFVLARQNEYVADKCAAEICGADVAAASLTRGAVVASYLSEDFWPHIYQKAGLEAEPPKGIYNGLRGVLSAPLEASVAQRWLTEAVCRPTDSVDTHPSLTQRLSHLQQEAHFSPRVGASAAEFYLGTQLESLTAQLESQWHSAVSGAWKQKHEQMAQARQKLEEIEGKVELGVLSDEEQWQRADATEDFGDRETAFTLFLEYLEAHPGEGRAHFAVGRLYLQRGDERGLEHLERAIELEHGAILPASQMAESFLLQRSRGDEATIWRERGLEFEDKIHFAQTERSAVYPSNVFLPHQLSEAELDAIRAHILPFEAVQEVYIARKQVEHFSDVPLYLIGIAIEKKKVNFASDEEKRKIAFNAAWTGLEFPHERIIVQLDSDEGRSFKKPLEKVENALVYRRAA